MSLALSEYFLKDTSKDVWVCQIPAADDLPDSAPSGPCGEQLSASCDTDKGTDFSSVTLTDPDLVGSGTFTQIQIHNY